MFTSIDAFLRYFDGLHRRTLRDVAALPPAAEAYKPATGEGENAWGIGELVRHMAGSRLYFARAYRGEGWVFEFPCVTPPRRPTGSRASRTPPPSSAAASRAHQPTGSAARSR